jgi:hypothetical protein
MDNLKGSIFFDGRTVEFLGRLLSPRGATSHLSDDERQLIQHREELIKINEELEYQLIRKLSEYKNYVPVLDGVFFFISAYRIGKLHEANQLLELAVRDERLLTRKELDEALEEIKTVSPDWIVNLLGSESDKRHPEKSRYAKPASSLNLEAMKNFK